jgi:hypothetical protein
MRTAEGRMLDTLRGYFFPRRIRRMADLRRFVSGEASYVAQRSTYEFVRNTLAWFGQSAFADKTFNDAFAICRWEAFAQIAADMTVIVRHHLDAGQTLDPALVHLYADMLAEYPHPAHRSDGWSDCHAALLARLGAQPAERPPDLAAMGRNTGHAIHDKVPAHSRNLDEERAVLSAAVTFHLISFQDRLPRRLDPAALAQALGGARS